MAPFTVRIKSVFVPSTWRTSPQSPTPAHADPIATAIQSQSPPSSPVTDEQTSPVCSASSTLNVHFPPEQVDHPTGSRSVPRCPPNPRRSASNSPSNYNTAQRPRAHSVPSSRRHESPSPYTYVRVPIIPGYCF